MKITFEANLSVRDKKLLGPFLAAIILLSALTMYLLVENHELSSNLEALRINYLALNETHVALQDKYDKLVETRSQLFSKMNSTVVLERKYWAVIGGNITLLPRDTLVVSIYLDEAETGYMGIDGVDRLELTWIGIYGPDLRLGQVKSANVKQYFGQEEKAERWMGERAIAFGPLQYPIKVHDPISNDTIVRESVSGVTFFFENYNYFGYAMPGNWVTIKLFYDGDVRLAIRELELYVVGFVAVKLGEAVDFKSAWIGNKVEVEIRHWGGMM